jgi:hypothetical protein
MRRQLSSHLFKLLLVCILLFYLLNPLFTNFVRASTEVQEDSPIVDPELTAKFDRSDSVSYMIYFEEEADLSPAYSLSWEERGQFVVDALTDLAETSQADVRDYLNEQGIDYEVFWIDNAIAVASSSRSVFEGLMVFGEIHSLTVIHEVQLVDSVSLESMEESGAVETMEAAAATSENRSVETNLTHINVDDVWSMGITGTGIVVGSIDTGVNYGHEALIDQYRGNAGGGIFNHDYNWYDAVNGGETAYDDHNHGSHTVGIMVGDDGGIHQIGVAPDAEWIACKAIESSRIGSQTDLLACGQFMLAPTRVDGTDADPDLRPHVVNNSWGDCSETYSDWYEDTIDAWLAAGVYPIFANGNAGNCGYSKPPELGTVGNPARSYHVTGVGSTGHDNGEYADHSNWGPTDSLDTLNPNGYPDLKPQVVAPGVLIRSALGNAYGESYYDDMSGTSMSAPHVAGLIALMWDSASCLVGEYVHTETLLQDTAVPIYYDDLMGEGARSPNYATGWGEIDALAAVSGAMDYCGSSTLNGSVADAGTGAPLSGALVEAAAQGDPANDRWDLTDENGVYSLPVWAEETYDLQVSLYSYETAAEQDVVVSTPGMTITTNFNLQKAGIADVSGTITDGSGHGYPLYALVRFEAGGHQEEVKTDPFSGEYGMDLYQNTAYEVVVSGLMDGYDETTESGVTFTGATATRDDVLELDEFCGASGYTIDNGIYQPFNEEIQPEGWQVVDDAGTGVVWRFDDPAGRSNLTGGTGPFAITDSDYYGYREVDTSLISPSLDLSGETSAYVSFDQDFYYYKNSNNEIADVDVSIDGGASWQNVLRQGPETESVRGPNQQRVDISSVAAGQPNVRVRFRYYDANFDYWWQVDNIRVGPYTCGMVPGGVMLGFVHDIDTGDPLIGAEILSANAGTKTQTMPDDPEISDGFYWLFQPLGSAIETISFTVTKDIYIDGVFNVNLTENVLTRSDFELKTLRTFFSIFYH